MYRFISPPGSQSENRHNPATPSRRFRRSSWVVLSLAGALGAFLFSAEPHRVFAQVQFESVPTLSTGTAFSQILWVDANGDAVPDLVSWSVETVGSPTTVAIRAGTPAGDLAAPVNVAIDGVAIRLQVADIDDDGFPDLITSNTTDPRIVIQRGLGASTFEAAGTVIDTIGQPFEMAVADLTGNGLPDIAYTASGVQLQHAIGVTLNSGGGTFGPIQVDTWLGSLRILKAGDTSSEPGLELFALNDSQDRILGYRVEQGVLVLRNLITTTSPRGLTLADFDADGITDLAVVGGSSGAPSLRVFQNDGTGQFSGVETFETGSRSRIVSGDFNGDGDLDVVSVGSFHEGNGDGTFRPAAQLAIGHGITPTSDSNLLNVLVSADVNQDGTSDALVSSQYPTDRRVVSLLGNSDAFQRPSSVSEVDNGIFRFVVGDMRIDGRADVVFRTGPELTYYRSNPDGNLWFESQVEAPGGDLVLGDVDLDGRLEAVTSSGGAIQTWGVSSSALVLEPLVGPSVGILELLSDLDGDGRLDLIGRSGIQLRIALWDDAVDTWGAPTQIDTPISPRAVLSLDLDNDGDLDLLIRSEFNVVTFFNDGSGIFTIDQTYSFGQTLSIATVDVNGDEFEDVIVAGQQGIRVVSNSGGTLGAPVVLFDDGSSALSIAVADFDNDDVPDLFVALQNERWLWFRGTGLDFDAPIEFGPESGTVPLYEAGDVSRQQIATGDFNGDGRPDLLGASGNVLSILHNETPGRFIRGDVDGDGVVAINDPVRLLNELLQIGPASECREAGDVNDDGVRDLSDAVSLLQLLFGPATVIPPAPYPDCGADPTLDSLDDCAVSSNGC